MFDRLVDRISAALWNLKPLQAVYLGKHEYDGVVPDLSEDAVEAQIGRLRLLRGQLAEADGLDADQELDRLQLQAEVDSELIRWDDIAWWRRNPMLPIRDLGITLYLTRDYAPLGHRAEMAATALDQAERVLGQMRGNLEVPVPEVYCRWAVRQAVGMAESLERDVTAAMSGDPKAEARLGEAAEGAAGALRGYAAWIEEELLPDATADFAVGAERLEAMLQRGELVDFGLGELLTMGEENLDENLGAFRETAAGIDPSLPPGEVYDRHVASVHATAEELISSTGAMLEDIRSFVVGHDLVTVPSEVRALVAETPRHLRWAFAMMSTPGPYETEAAGAYYYVTPVEPDWEDATAEEWLKTLNSLALEDISIHEAYPGHYVQFLHYRRAPTEVSKRVTSYAFVEGWAHYAEQMLWESGYRDGDPRFRLAQLAEALVRNCRFLCAIRMHTGGMSLDEATRFFVDNAYYEDLAARKEAERGSFDPGYYSYTLGKLQILRLRDDCRAAAGPGFDLKDFHDRLLSRGAPPVEVIRKVLLP